MGTARTALYNWLFARHHKGSFIVRIEDTDVARSSAEMVDVILESLDWFGLNWDEELYYQSQRLDLYRRYAHRLLDEGRAYWCYCSAEELEKRKRSSIARTKAWKYDRRCLGLSERKREGLENRETPRALRFLVPEGRTGFDDLVHGRIERDNSEIEDFVVLKSDGTPAYNFAVVIDDYEMKITHVIRGDDHITNTPKQLLVYRALGFAVPKFAHLPLILGEDRSKLSKRHGPVSVPEYRDRGYLPDAFVNFLALLGWSPGDEREILSREELVRLFSLSRVIKRGAIFDVKKLDWMNGEYVKRMDNSSLLEAALPFLKRSGLVTDEDAKRRRDYLLQVMGILKERATKLTDFGELGYYFFRENFEYDVKGVEKHFSQRGIADRLELLTARLGDLGDFSSRAIEALYRKAADELGTKAAKLIHPTRLALTGVTGGPGLFELMEILGRDAVIARLTRAVEFARKTGKAAPSSSQA